MNIFIHVAGFGCRFWHNRFPCSHMFDFTTVVGRRPQNSNSTCTSAYYDNIVSINILPQKLGPDHDYYK